MAIRGDRDQLESLSLTVNDYIGQLLAHSHTELPIVYPERSLASDLSPKPYTFAARIPANSEPTQAQEGDPDLQLRARTLLVHELELGDLATEVSGPAIPLTVSQLFDLASALDECAEEMAMLPEQGELPEHPQPWLRSPPIWARSAAVVVLMVGVTTATLKLHPSRILKEMPQTSSPISLDREQSIAESPADSQSPSTSQTDRLLPSTPSPTGPLSVPSPAPHSSPSRSDPAPSFSRTTPVPSSVPSRAPISSAPTLPMQSRPQQPQHSQTKPSTGAQPSVRLDHEDSPSRLTLPRTKLKTVPATPKPQTPGITATKSPAFSTAPKSESPKPAAPQEAPSLRQRPESDVLPSLPESAGYSNDALEAQAQADNRQQRGRRSQTQPSTAIAPPQAKSKPLPQATEVQQYVAQRWQAPPNLSQTLQYLLVLNVNGSLQRIQPVGVTATQYLNQIPLPNLNQPFVSPLTGSSSATIRLILEPDGTVQTVPDASN